MYINWVYTLPKETLLKQTLVRRLKKAGYDPVQGKKFIYAEGEIPVLLTAHVDTVHWDSPPENIFLDRKKRVLWSPEGVGGDDRAGISIIVEILERGDRPHILITDDEECGSLGAQEAIKKLKPPSINYMLGLDRKGKEDACFYSGNNREFEKFICEFGFNKATGSTTDVAVLGPAWDIAAANLSVGYYEQHTRYEHVLLDHCQLTRNKVIWMLNTESEAYDFQERKVISYVHHKRHTPVRSKRKTTVSPQGSTRKQWRRDDREEWVPINEDNERDASSNLYRGLLLSALSGEYYGKVYEAYIELAELVTEFGGTHQQWADWLEEQSWEIQSEVDDIFWCILWQMAEEAMLFGDIKERDSHGL